MVEYRTLTDVTPLIDAGEGVTVATIVAMQPPTE
jgi:hypothetical protein